MKKENPKVIWVLCTGEAHSNPLIDHCMICVPYWEVYPTCPVCNSKVRTTKRRGFAFYCGLCNIYLEENMPQRMEVYGKALNAAPVTVETIEESISSSYWNYRIVKSIHPREITYAVHEVYFNKDNIPYMMTQDEVSPAGMDRAEFSIAMKHYQESLAKPVLIYHVMTTKFIGEESPIE